MLGWLNFDFPMPTMATKPVLVQGPVSGKILSLEPDLNSLITLVTIVFSRLKIIRGLKIFWETGPKSLLMLRREYGMWVDALMTDLTSSVSRWAGWLIGWWVPYDNVGFHKWHVHDVGLYEGLEGYRYDVSVFSVCSIFAGRLCCVTTV